MKAKATKINSVMAKLVVLAKNFANDIETATGEKVVIEYNEEITFHIPKYGLKFGLNKKIGFPCCYW